MLCKNDGQVAHIVPSIPGRDGALAADTASRPRNGQELTYLGCCTYYKYMAISTKTRRRDATPRRQPSHQPRRRGPKGSGALAQALPSTGCARLLLSLSVFPDRSWGIRELMREAGLSPGQASTELARLIRLGVVKKETSAGRPRYTVVTQSEAWRSYFAVLRCHASPGEVLTHALAPLRNKVERACIFGSFTREEQRDDSDVDVLVIDDHSNGRAVTSNCLAAAHILGREVNPVTLTSRQWESMVAAGHPFAASVLNTNTVPLVERGGT